MATLYLVRHGRAAAGWDAAVDPPLDDLGTAQADAVARTLHRRLPGAAVDVVTSPLRRCQETALAFSKMVGIPAMIEARVAEIPSPDGVAMGERVTWLQRIMQGTWAQLIASEGEHYGQFHRDLLSWARAVRRDTVVFSHFIAINALIGAATSDDRVVVRRLDNASLTIIDVAASGAMSLVSGGDEADTLIR